MHAHLVQGARTPDRMRQRPTLWSSRSCTPQCHKAVFSLALPGTVPCDHHPADSHIVQLASSCSKGAFASSKEHLHYLLFLFLRESKKGCGSLLHILQVFAQVPTSQPKLITRFSTAAKLYGIPMPLLCFIFFIALTHFQILCIIFFFILLYAFPSSRVFLSG